MNVLAISDGSVFAIGAFVFVAVATAAVDLAMQRFAELSDEEPDDPREPVSRQADETP
jgi:hypothetical protein